MADIGERPEGPLGLKKKSQKKEKSVGQVRKKNWALSLAKGVDPPLICMTEALLASDVSCWMISMKYSSLLNEERRLVWPADI